MRKFFFWYLIGTCISASVPASALTIINSQEVFASNGDQVQISGPFDSADVEIGVSLFVNTNFNSLGLHYPDDIAGWEAGGSFGLYTCEQTAPGPCGRGAGSYRTDAETFVSSPEIITIGTFFDSGSNTSLFPGITGSVSIGLSIISGAGFSLSAPAVPEPSTWAMLLIGFVGIGLAANWRRGRKTFCGAL
jgi:PEP-CTERM motif